MSEITDRNIERAPTGSPCELVAGAYDWCKAAVGNPAAAHRQFVVAASSFLYGGIIEIPNQLQNHLPETVVKAGSGVAIGASIKALSAIPRFKPIMAVGVPAVGALFTGYTFNELASKPKVKAAMKHVWKNSDYQSERAAVDVCALEIGVAAFDFGLMSLATIGGHKVLKPKVGAVSDAVPEIPVGKWLKVELSRCWQTVVGQREPQSVSISGKDVNTAKLDLEVANRAFKKIETANRVSDFKYRLPGRCEGVGPDTLYKKELWDLELARANRNDCVVRYDHVGRAVVRPRTDREWHLIDSFKDWAEQLVPGLELRRVMAAAPETRYGLCDSLLYEVELPANHPALCQPTLSILAEAIHAGYPGYRHLPSSSRVFATRGFLPGYGGPQQFDQIPGRILFEAQKNVSVPCLDPDKLQIGLSY